MKYRINEAGRLETEPVVSHGDMIQVKEAAHIPVEIVVSRDDGNWEREIQMSFEDLRNHIQRCQWLLENHPSVRSGEPAGIEVKEWS